MTEILKAGKNSIAKAADIIKAGGIVAFPTETVYGLGANAFDETAVKKIFQAKGRPADNPLIVHIADIGGLAGAAAEIPDKVKRLIETLGSAPLTYIVKKSKRIPDTVTAGLDTVAVRIPAHPAALALIKACGLPVAAPSANASGRPSPTSAAHVYADLNGKIPLILDGGECRFGVESTVVDFTPNIPLILRTGGFSKEELERLLQCETRLYKKPENAPARSPGMKYRHYAPRCKIEVVTDYKNVAESLKKAYDNHVQKGDEPAIICQDTYRPDLGGRVAVFLGRTPEDAAKALFRVLRENEDKHGVLICHTLPDEGIGRAFNDRLLRAASKEQ